MIRNSQENGATKRMTDRFSLSGRSLNEINNAIAINDEGIPCTQRKVCRLLNELHNENEQLKMKNDNLIKISAMIQVRNDKLSKENKELKYHLNRTEKELEEYKEFMSLG